VALNTIDLARPGRASVPPVAKALCAQALAWVAVQMLAAFLPGGAYGAMVAQCALAAAIGRGFGLASWWTALNAAFPVLVSGAIAVSIDPLWYLGAFLSMAAVYWSTFRTQVPLFLSNQRAVRALADLLPEGRPVRLLDVGCGTGTVLAGLARLRPADHLEGVEIAPLPYGIASLRARWSKGRFTVSRHDLWTESFAPYDVVYAFLSPVPMPALWRKVRAEMRPGTLFVSNTFDVPGVAPDRVITLGDGRRALLVWRL
jgi:SAM-dependent methyltransferase